MDSRWSRVLRGSLAGTVATLVAAVSHSVAAGGVPSALGISLALAFSVLVSIALTGRGLSLMRLAASVVLSQLAFHVVFSTLGGDAEVVTTGHHQTVVSGASMVTHASNEMWLAHGIAALITVLALRFGEGAFYGLHNTARMLLVAMLSPSAPHTVALDRAPKPAPTRPLVARIVREFHAALGFRGPPPLLRGA